jgi:hypothetical protein
MLLWRDLALWCKYIYWGKHPYRSLELLRARNGPGREDSGNCGAMLMLL